MKCPKCHYLSFDPEPRCRNCGYTLNLDPDLAIHPDPAPDAPLVDLTLRDTNTPATRDDGPRQAQARRAQPAPAETTRRARTTTPGPFDMPLDAFASEHGDDVGAQAPPPSEAAVVPPPPPAAAHAGPPAEPRARRQSPPPTAELPLFVKGIGGETAIPEERRPPAPEDVGPPEGPSPTVAPPPVAARRRSTDSAGRERSSDSPRFGPLDRDLLEGLQRIEHAEQRKAAAEARRAQAEHAVGAGQRLGAATVDAALLGALAAGIVSATLRWTDLSWSQLQVLPLVPVAAFVLLVVTGYLFMFTAASGQTAGKMLMRIRVVDAGHNGTGQDRVSVRQALYRGALTVPSVLLLGAGFLPALGGDGRALHDRLTQTRVVRA
jgi:uncharacterized RDD family membrane protein YckC